jgi:hypothetical protein
MIRIIFAIIVILHGLIHLIGFMRAFKLATISQLTQSISRPVGLLWLFTALLFLAVSVIFLIKEEWWWMIAAPAILLSQVLIIICWQDAKYGTIANIIILIATIVSFGNWQFQTMVRREIKSFNTITSGEKRILTNDMLDTLPTVVQKWLKRSNVTGKEMIQTVYLEQKGEMRTTPDGRWMPYEARQWFITDKPGFIWEADVKAAPGIHLKGRDKYENGQGHMLIKLLSLFTVADATGSETNQGAMLRYLAEIIWFPSAAVSDYIQWEQIDTVTAEATMTFGDITASGIFNFNTNYDLISFEARRYYDRKEGATMEDWLIQADQDGYREFDGIRIPASGTVTWKLKEGDYRWLKLEIGDIHYNKQINE